MSLDDLRQRVARFMAPISDALPAGAALTTDDRADFIRDQVAKLEQPTGGQPDWGQVVSLGGEILEQSTKDYLTAIYVAFGLYQTRGIRGLLDGLTLVAELQETYWDTMFPDVARIRRRANALAWLVGRLEPALVTTNVARLDRNEVKALKEVTDHLVTSTRQRFDSNAPAVGPLRDAVGRLVASLPPEPPPPPPPSATPEVYTPEPEVSAPVVEAPAVYYPEETASSTGAGVGDLASVEAAAEWFGSVGDSLVRAAGVLRAANPQDPHAYRVLREGAWIRYLAPPLDEQGALVLEGPDAGAREELDSLAAGEAWTDLVERAEVLAAQYPLWLDLQRIVSEAMGVMGDEWDLPRNAVLVATAAFLRRMPDVPKWKFTDGGATADDATRRWITRAIGTPRPGALGAAPKDSFQSAVEDAQGLVAGGDTVGAIALLQRRVSAATSAAARFRARLALARIASQAGSASLSRALFEQLDQEVTTHHLETWDPALAAECLEGHVVALRVLAEAGVEIPPVLPALYDRLSRVDPIAAARLGG